MCWTPLCDVDLTLSGAGNDESKLCFYLENESSSLGDDVIDKCATSC